MELPRHNRYGAKGARTAEFASLVIPSHLADSAIRAPIRNFPCVPAFDWLTRCYPNGMKKKALITVFVLAVLVGTLSIIISVAQSRSRKALNAYKAKLRAQGEALTFEEAGYPFPLETNANLENFIGLADQLRGKSDHPASIMLMPFQAPGRAVLVWAGGSLKRSTPLSNKSSNAPSLSWDELSKDMNSAAGPLAELRVELEHPPRYFGWDFKNPFNDTARNPFVQKRVVAQFLSADTLVALHERQLPRAQADLHALTQLAQVHRGDVTLVSAMIRVAIAGLALSSTWQALPAEGWDESSLAALQKDWEALDLGEALETGFVGERLFGEQAFRLARQTNLDAQAKMISLGTASKAGWAGFADRLASKGTLIYWRGHADKDELFYLQDSQFRVESVRRFRSNAGARSLSVEIKAQHAALEQAFDAPLGKYQHMLSAISIPNYSKAFQVMARNETQRRMTITVIALKRFYLRQGRHPASLSELVPAFLAAELIDPWSGKPFHYQLHQDGGFTLYSVGEDGQDDGGDPTSTGDKTPFEMWMGKDMVWPKPVFRAATVD
jgi:hypothetical protein